MTGTRTQGRAPPPPLGAFAPLSFEGDLTVDIRLTGINGDATVVLPGACDHPIAA